MSIATLKALAAQATAGPWYHCQPFQRVKKTLTFHGPVHGQRVDFVSTNPAPVHERIVIPMEREDCPSVRSADMALIAAMRNHIDALLAVAEAAQEVADDLEVDREAIARMRAALARLEA